MEIKRAWAMPNSRTFEIKPIRELIDKYISDKQLDGKFLNATQNLAKQ